MQDKKERSLVISTSMSLDGVPVTSADLLSMYSQVGMLPGVIQHKLNYTAIILWYMADEKDPSWVKSFRERLR